MRRPGTGPGPAGRENLRMASAPEQHDGADGAPVPGRFRPRMSLQTLTRGDGLLGLRAVDGFGPRGAQVTVARVAWTYVTDTGLRWDTPAPDRVLNSRAPSTQALHDAVGRPVLLQRDLAAEADARDALW